MRVYALDLVLGLFVIALLVGACCLVRSAHADGAPPDAGAIAAGSAGSGGGSAAIAPTDKPSDKLHNPVDDPLASVDDVRKAKSGGGWSLAVLAALVILFHGLAKISTVYDVSWLAFLAKGKVASGLAILGAGAAAAFDSLAYGGNWFAVAIAGIGAALLWKDPKPAPAPGAAS